MGMADIAQVLWVIFYLITQQIQLGRIETAFILSNGHGSMLLYSLLHLTGYDLPIEELKISVNYTPKHQGTLNMAMLQVLRQRLGL